jgi:predicted ArsR family transcriptional regulator
LVQREDILDLIRRRPCSLDDIAAGLGMHRTEVLKHLEELAREGLVQVDALDQKNQYTIATRTACPRSLSPPNNPN